MLGFGNFHIEPIARADSWEICNFVVANEHRLKRYFPITLKENLTPDLSKIFTQNKVKEFSLEEEFLFTLKERNTNHLVGLFYIKELNWNKKQGELAYCVGYQHEGSGIASNTIKVLSNHAFENLGLTTLQIIVHKGNKASIKVAENCNFTWIKTLEKQHTPPNEKPMDMELYELYKEIE